MSLTTRMAVTRGFDCGRVARWLKWRPQFRQQIFNNRPLQSLNIADKVLIFIFSCYSWCWQIRLCSLGPEADGRIHFVAESGYSITAFRPDPVWQFQYAHVLLSGKISIVMTPRLANSGIPVDVFWRNENPASPSGGTRVEAFIRSIDGARIGGNNFHANRSNSSISFIFFFHLLHPYSNELKGLTKKTKQKKTQGLLAFRAWQSVIFKTVLIGTLEPHCRCAAGLFGPLCVTPDFLLSSLYTWKTSQPIRTEWKDIGILRMRLPLSTIRVRRIIYTSSVY